jgi:hypothetical protein
MTKSDTWRLVHPDGTEDLTNFNPIEEARKKGIKEAYNKNEVINDWINQIIIDSKLIKIEDVEKMIDIPKLRKDFELRIERGCLDAEAFIFVLEEFKQKLYSQWNKVIENGGSTTQGSSNTFEPKAYRLCNPVRNDKSKEAPEITNKYGRNTERSEVDADETGRSRKNIPAETITSGSSADTFNLLNKRREIFHIFVGTPHIAQIYRIILEQDKEFIRLLKEEIRKGSCATPTAYDIIDKLSGGIERKQ